MNREGDIFKYYVDRSDLTIDRVLEITGISRGQLYSLFGKVKIADKWKERINKLELSIDWNDNSTEYSELENEISPDTFNLIKQAKANLEAENKRLKKEKEERDHEIIESLRVYRMLVEQGIRDGIVKFIPKRSQAEVGK